MEINNLLNLLNKHCGPGFTYAGSGGCTGWTVKENDILVEKRGIAFMFKYQYYEKPPEISIVFLSTYFREVFVERLDEEFKDNSCIIICKPFINSKRLQFYESTINETSHSS